MKPKTTITTILLLAVTLLCFSCTVAAPRAGIDPDAMFEYAEIMTPLASGIVTKEIDHVIIDYSHTYYGYIMVRHIECESIHIRIVVEKPNGMSNIYALNPESGFDALPLTGGDGTYNIKVLKHVEGTQFTELLSSSTDVILTNEFNPFLHPSQKVNFSNYCAVVRRAAELTASIYNVPDKISAISNYIVSNIAYDDDLIEMQVFGYIPDVNNVYARGSGLCLDFSTLFVAMLRSQIIPAKLVVGSAGEIYHAWVEVHDGEQWKIFDLTVGADPLTMEKIEEMNFTAEFIY